MISVTAALCVAHHGFMTVVTCLAGSVLGVSIKHRSRPESMSPGGVRKSQLLSIDYIYRLVPHGSFCG
jgi:hypothetical protein